MPTAKRKDTIGELSLLKSGIEAKLASSTLVVSGVPYTTAQAVAILDAAIDSAQAIVDAHGSLTDALRDDAVWQKTNAPKVKGLRDLISVMYATQHGALAEFGLEPRKTREPLTGDERLSRAAKARATRAKRRTLGKRQRLAIKGDVTGISITPTTASTSNAAGEAAESGEDGA